MAAAPIKILTSMATREALQALADAYPDAAARPIAIENIGGVKAAERVRGGEVLDVIVLADNVIDGLIAEGKLRPGRFDFASSGVTMCVPKGRALPNISNGDAVKQAVLAATAVCYSTGPSGVYLEKLFAQWGIADALKSKLVVAPPGVPVGGLVAEGKADLGFQQLSELIHLSGIEIVGGLPPDIQKRTMFSAGIPVASTNPEGARAVLAYMTAPAAADLKRKNGMEPA